jgi:NitT/TauT family transport system substrate-binding protein
MAGTNSDPFGEPLFCKAAGAFDRAGFDLDVTSMANAGAVAGAIGGGALELGIGDLISGVNAIQRGVPNLLLAGSGMYLSTDKIPVLATAKDGPIQKAGDLIGKTIGVPTLVGLTTAALRAWLPKNGVDVESVKLVEIVASAAFPAVQHGTLDAALVAEPFYTPYREQIRVLGLPMDVIAKAFCQSVWYGTKPWFEADRDRAHRVLNAIYETSRWCNAHRDETFAVLVRDAHFDGERLKGMIRTTYLAAPITPALVQPVLNVGYQTKVFDRQLDANAIIAKV